MKRLLDEAQLGAGVRQLADQINGFYGRRPVSLVGVLTGSIVFVADLIRHLHMPLRLGLVQASSYRGRSQRPGPLIVNSSMLPDIEGRDVLLVDDIFDTGHTLTELIELIDELRPASVRSVVLMRKRDRCRVARQPDHVGFDIPDAFVVGYGLDYNDMYRNLPYVAALEPADLEEETAA